MTRLIYLMLANIWDIAQASLSYPNKPTDRLADPESSQNQPKIVGRIFPSNQLFMAENRPAENRPTKNRRKTSFARFHSVGFTSVRQKILVGSMKKFDRRFLVGIKVDEFARVYLSINLSRFTSLI